MIKQVMLSQNRLIVVTDQTTNSSIVWYNGECLGSIGGDNDAIDVLMLVSYRADGRPTIGYNFLIPYVLIGADDEDAAIISNYFNYREDLTPEMEHCIFNEDWDMLASLMGEVDLGFAL